MKIPAFPVNQYEGSWIDGMDLRDYFAAKAMSADITGMRGGDDMEYASIAERAYEMADVMIKAREESK